MTPRTSLTKRAKSALSGSKNWSSQSVCTFINQTHKYTPFCYNVCMDKIDARKLSVESYSRHPLARYAACI
jgi:hypothetical protein